MRIMNSLFCEILEVTFNYEFYDGLKQIVSIFLEFKNKLKSRKGF